MLLGLLVGAATVGNTYWLLGHLLALPPPWDQAWYLYLSLRYHDAFAEGGPLPMLREFVHLSRVTAPLLPLTTVPFYWLFGPSRLVAHLANAAFLLLLVVGVHRLATAARTPRAGLLAAFLVATFPLTINASRDYLLELPSTALLTVAMYALLRSDGFRSRPWSVGFGLLTGLVALAKTMTPVFLAGPVLAALGPPWPAVRGIPAVNIAAALAGASAIAGVWWLPNFRYAAGYLAGFGFGDAATPFSPTGFNPFTLGNLTFYGLELVNVGISLPMAILFFGLGLGRAARALDARRQRAQPPGAPRVVDRLLWTWLGVGYAIVTIVPNKPNEKFGMMLVPAVAVLVAIAIEDVRRVALRQALTIAALLVGAFNWLGMTTGLPGVPRVVYVHPIAVVAHVYPHYEWIRGKLPAGGTPEQSWPHAAVVASVHERSTATTRVPVVLVVPDHPLVNANTLLYYAARDRRAVRFESAAWADRDLDGYDFVLLKDGGDQGDDFARRRQAEVHAALRREPEKFGRVADFPFPDGSRLVLYAGAAHRQRASVEQPR